MFKLLTRRWKYLVAKLSGSAEANADPKIQLEQAIGEANSQHRRLKEQAANVIANQKQAEIRLNAKMEERENLDANARQALTMASEAEASGDQLHAAEYARAAETIADRLIAVESDVESLKAMVLESTDAADRAKEAVQQNARLLQEKIAEKSKLTSQMDQARMQEEMNDAMSSLTETVGDDVPTLDEVRTRIEARYAKAKATAELNDAGVENRVREIERATANVAARDRLSEMRSELGLQAADTPTPLESGGPAPDTV
ncbi:PspA/IM30 family protein [Ilumatobacter sp.]|uniref:PspA/IM30 family protein n=1 Tax=Ilumatobacter sp. TaxID=1967498 RepID=UPI003B51F784